MRIFLYLLACAAGLALALLGNEPLLGIGLVAILLYPLGLAIAATAERADPATADRRADRALRGGSTSHATPLAGAVLAGAAGTLLVVLLVRLAVAAPGWVDPLAADCGGPSTGAQQLATWFATLVFVLAALPEAVNVVAVGGRLSRSRPLSQLPISLSLYPIAVAAAGIALIVASWATSC